MELYDSLIRRSMALGGAAAPRRWSYDPARAWPDTGEFELVMLRDAACELGGGSRSAVNYTCVTTTPGLVDADEILLWGPDLRELKGDTDYARITLLEVDPGALAQGEDTEQSFRAIQELDFIKYKIFPRGYMIRTSSESSREQVRLSKAALREGISFERVGAAFIRRYRQDPKVRHVRMLFLTAPDADHTGAAKCARSVRDITMSLTKILEGMPTNCGSCQLKPICDEVEGLKELHFGKKGRQ